MDEEVYFFRIEVWEARRVSRPRFGRNARAKHTTTVVRLGGLHIVGTERHEARRIDNQLRGRAGRQGDPGSSRFFLSLEDDLMRIFGSDRMSGLMQRLGMEEGVPVEAGMVTRAIERAQKQVEAQNFSYRKHLLEYDDVMNKQRVERLRIAAPRDPRRTGSNAPTFWISTRVRVHRSPRIWSWSTGGCSKETGLRMTGTTRHSPGGESRAVRVHTGARGDGTAFEQLGREESMKSLLGKRLPATYAEKEEEIGLRDLMRRSGALHHAPHRGLRSGRTTSTRWTT